MTGRERAHLALKRGVEVDRPVGEHGDRSSVGVPLQLVAHVDEIVEHLIRGAVNLDRVPDARHDLPPPARETGDRAPQPSEPNFERRNLDVNANLLSRYDGRHGPSRQPQVAPREDGRRQRSAASRARILKSAALLFASDGYAATTMDMIAAEAGLAVQTVKYTYHTKARVLLEVIEMVAAAGDPLPVPQRAWFREATTADSPHRRLAVTVEYGTDIFVRLAPLTAAIATAATTDPEVRRCRRATDAARRAGLAAIVTALQSQDHLNPRLTAQQALDVLVVQQSPQNLSVARLTQAMRVDGAAVESLATPPALPHPPTPHHYQRRAPRHR